jgi:hypothetical protein
MTLSRRSIATLLDLVEIKLSCLEVFDREDAREVKALNACKTELLTLLRGGAPIPMPTLRARSELDQQQPAA